MPARWHCRPWPVPPTPTPGASACVAPWTCPTWPRASRHFEVWPRPRRSTRWVRSASTSWAGQGCGRSGRGRGGVAAGPTAPSQRRVDQLRPGPVTGKAGQARRSDSLLHGGPIAPSRDGPRAGPYVGVQGRASRGNRDLRRSAAATAGQRSPPWLSGQGIAEPGPPARSRCDPRGGHGGQP